MLDIKNVSVGGHLQIIWVATVVVLKIEEDSFFVTLAIQEKLDKLVQLAPLLGLLLLDFTFCLLFLWGIFHLCHSFLLGRAL